MPWTPLRARSSGSYPTGGYTARWRQGDGGVFIVSDDGKRLCVECQHGRSCCGPLILIRRGRSVPVVANGVVYVNDDRLLDVYALNASTGALLWQYANDRGTVSTRSGQRHAVYPVLRVLSMPLVCRTQMSEKFSPPQRPDPARLTPEWKVQSNTGVTPTKVTVKYLRNKPWARNDSRALLICQPCRGEMVKTPSAQGSFTKTCRPLKRTLDFTLTPPPR